MEQHQCVSDGAWQACAASMMLAHGGQGFDHLSFNELVALFRQAHLMAWATPHTLLC